jgi:hypothetical protein
MIGNADALRMVVECARPHLDPRDIRSSVAQLLGHGLIGIKPGSGRYANEYLLALPRRIAGSMLAAVADEALPLF